MGGEDRAALLRELNRLQRLEAHVRAWSRGRAYITAYDCHLAIRELEQNRLADIARVES